MQDLLLEQSSDVSLSHSGEHCSDLGHRLLRLHIQTRFLRACGRGWAARRHRVGQALVGDAARVRPAWYRAGTDVCQIL